LAPHRRVTMSATAAASVSSAGCCVTITATPPESPFHRTRPAFRDADGRGLRQLRLCCCRAGYQMRRTSTDPPLRAARLAARSLCVNETADGQHSGPALLNLRDLRAVTRQAL
jgi:hypothetical protein